MAGKGDNIKKPFTIDGLKTYLKGIDFSKWKPSLIVVHHCAAPSLKQRPKGFVQQHMENLENYYEDDLGWSGAPHVFTDEDQAWVFNPLNEPGTHAVSFNRTGIGIEMLGDYDEEDPWSGRGLQVLTMTAQVVKVFLEFFGLGIEAIRFHRDDPKTNKTCPGEKISKEKFLALVRSV
jgi:hypothetical protein